MDKKKAAAMAAVTAAAAAGMVSGAVFESPAELVPEAVAQVQQTEKEQAVSETRQKGPAAAARAWVLGLPAVVRALVGVPLWCLGSVLLSALSLFWAGTAPVLAGLLDWLCLAAVLLAVFAFSVKAAFPDAPFRRILRLRNVVLLAALSVLLWAADMALPAMWEGYGAVTRTVWRVGAACLLAFLCGMELKIQGRRAARARQTAEPPRRTAVEREALRLADTVCRDGRTF